MIRYLLLIYLLAKRHIIGPIGPLFKELAHEHLHLALMRSLWDRFRKIMMLSSQLFFSNQDPEEFFYFIDVLENSFTLQPLEGARNLDTCRGFFFTYPIPPAGLWPGRSGQCRWPGSIVAMITMVAPQAGQKIAGCCFWLRARERQGATRREKGADPFFPYAGLPWHRLRWSWAASRPA
jgi:hypothetical protein